MPIPTMAPQRPRVLIVDDHPVVRMGLRAVIEQSGRYEVCGEAGAPAEALKLAAGAERMGAAAGWEPNPEGGSVFFLDLPREAGGSDRAG